MTIYQISGRVPFGRSDYTGLYYDRDTFTPSVGCAVLCWEHWRHDDHVAAAPVRYAALDTAIYVDGHLDDTIRHERAWLEAIRAGGVYLSHGIGELCATPTKARNVIARVDHVLATMTPAERWHMMHTRHPLRGAGINHWSLTRSPAMPQDITDAVVVVGVNIPELIPER